jgi:hypothetical protein
LRKKKKEKKKKTKKEKKKKKTKKKKKEKEKLQRCVTLQRSATMPLQTKQTQKKKKKVSILPDRGRVGLVGARTPALTPQQQLHSSSFRSTTRALAME